MCNAEMTDSGVTHHDSCYCDEDQGCGYTFSDEYGPCEFCSGTFETGTLICADEHNEPRVCPDFEETLRCPEITT